jgi:hypothetical protein
MHSTQIGSQEEHPHQQILHQDLISRVLLLVFIKPAQEIPNEEQQLNWNWQYEFIPLYQRTRLKVFFQRMVHTHLETFIPRQAQIVPNVPPEERHAYEHKIIQPQNIHLEAVSGQDFRFDILGTPSSPWNKSAARVFANLAIQQLCLPDTVEIFKAIRHGFTQYLDTIIRRYKVSLKTSSEIEALHAAKARHTRKYQVFIYSPGQQIFI